MKKMILIDPRLLEKPYTPPDTVTDNLRDLDHQMQQVLENEDLPPREKARVYQQTLQRYLNRLEQYRQKPLGVVDIKEQKPEVSSLPVPVVEAPHQSTPHQSTPLHPTPLQPVTPKSQPAKIETTPPYKLRRSKKTSKIPTPKWEKWPRK